MKKLLFVISIIFLFTPQLSYADTDHARPLDEILNEIRTEQNIDSNSQIDCDLITEDQLEELGDAVMAQMHPDEETHEAMDEMMGGEGSESLRNAHINMGSRYLGCDTGFENFPMMGGMMNMMGGGMMNTFSNSDFDRGGDFNMMGWGDGYGYGMMNPYFGGTFGILGIVFWTLLIVLLIALIRYFWRRGDKK